MRPVDGLQKKAAEEGPVQAPVPTRKVARPERSDPLTGLANRPLFVNRLNAAFAVTRRGGEPFALLYLDIDRFKDVNDTLGHLAGDALLKAVAKRLRQAVRDSDLVARLGGDEFALLQTDLGDIGNAGSLAVKICAALARPYAIEGSEVHMTVSVGISFFVPEVSGPAEMLAQAEQALARAKKGGRDRYRFHTAELDEMAQGRLAPKHRGAHAEPAAGADTSARRRRGV